MLNPSTADGERDDPTIRRCVGFAADAGFGSLAVANLFALRATDPRELVEHPDPAGPENERWIERLVAESSAVLVAWGNHPLANGAGERLLARLAAEGPRLFCLGLTRDGAPRHPLYTARKTGLLAFPSG